MEKVRRRMIYARLARCRDKAHSTTGSASEMSGPNRFSQIIEEDQVAFRPQVFDRPIGWSNTNQRILIA